MIDLEQRGLVGGTSKLQWALMLIKSRDGDAGSRPITTLATDVSIMDVGKKLLDHTCGADDITHIYNRQMFRNLRFQMQ
jgi:hypothetical protein